MKKKILVTLLIATMVMACFVGCGEKEKESEDASSTEEPMTMEELDEEADALLYNNNVTVEDYINYDIENSDETPVIEQMKEAIMPTEGEDTVEYTVKDNDLIFTVTSGIELTESDKERLNEFYDNATSFDFLLDLIPMNCTEGNTANVKIIVCSNGNEIYTREYKMDENKIYVNNEFYKDMED